MDLIKLNVGGAHREVSRETLCKSPVIESVLNDVTLKKESIFIDRDANLFDEVILYLSFSVKPDNPNELGRFFYFFFNNLTKH